MGMYESAVEEKKDEIKNEKPESIYRIATVTGMFEDGYTPKLTFVGEDTESNKKYGYLYSYIPTLNDIVLLAKTDSTFVILGKYAYNIAPDPGTTNEDIVNIISEQLDENKVVKFNSNDVINVNTTIYYNFFRLLDAELLRTNRFAMNNQTPIITQSVPNLSTSSDLATVITKINTIISKLRSFGLFTT